MFILPTAYALATVLKDIPKTRHVVHRGFIESGDPDKVLLLSTTDTRAEKVAQVLSNPAAEIAWWFRSSNEQFRISVTISIVPASQHPAYADHLKSFHQPLDEDFDWEAERRRLFNEMSSHMRASWARPAPKSPIQDDPQKWPTTLPKIGEGKDQKENETVQFALGNFALLVLKPLSVDHVELSPMPNRRTLYTKAQNGQWSVEKVVP